MGRRGIDAKVKAACNTTHPGTPRYIDFKQHTGILSKVFGRYLFNYRKQ